MKTFKEFTSNRKYVSVQYDDKTQKRLRDWAIENGFDLTVDYNDNPQSAEDFDFHTTIFYSTNEVNLRNQTLSHKPSNVSVVGFDLFGKDHNIPVLKLKVEGELQKLREKYEKLGLKDEWPSYQPHISLSYAKQKIDIDQIKLPTFDITFDKLIIKDIED